MEDITVILPGPDAERLRDLFPGPEPWQDKIRMAVRRVELYEKKIALNGAKGRCSHCGKKLTEADRERLGLNNG